MRLREATPEDVDAITRVVNRANVVEAFFVDGDRTDPAAVREAMAAGRFLVLDDGAAVVGAVHLAVSGEVGHFSMLAVEPSRQCQGFGNRLVAAAESWFAEQGARWSELEMVNRREDLLPWYRRLGYRVVGTAPYVEWRATKLPVHFVIMRKPLASAGEGGTVHG